jgi:hypothetical protein
MIAAARIAGVAHSAVSGPTCMISSEASRKKHEPEATAADRGVI